jgi:hypothetical protein
VSSVVSGFPSSTIPQPIEFLRLVAGVTNGVASSSWARTSGAGQCTMLIQLIVTGAALDRKWPNVNTGSDTLVKDPSYKFILCNSYTIYQVYAAAMSAGGGETALCCSSSTAATPQSGDSIARTMSLRSKGSKHKSSSSSSHLRESASSSAAATPTQGTSAMPERPRPATAMAYVPPTPTAAPKESLDEECPLDNLGSPSATDVMISSSQAKGTESPVMMTSPGVMMTTTSTKGGR